MINECFVFNSENIIVVRTDHNLWLALTMLIIGVFRIGFEKPHAILRHVTRQWNVKLLTTTGYTNNGFLLWQETVF